MQDSPDKAVLLAGVATFLKESVLPAIDDRALGFRVRIAAHLVATVAREVTSEEAADEVELAGLVALGLAESAVSPPAIRDGIARGRASWAQALRDGRAPEGTDDVMAQSLASRLRVSNPRFSLDLDTGEDEWDS